jgi:AcrR family transcriptional regulator
MSSIEQKSMLCYEQRMASRASARVRSLAAGRRRASAAREEPARARLDVDERRRQLVALGVSLFSERTYDEVSIDELAQAAGISKGLLYHYFPTKRDFYVATVREVAAQLLERTATPEQMEPLARLEAGLDVYIDYVSKHGKPYQALLRSGIGADAEVARIVDETRDAFCARLTEGAPVASTGPLVRVALRGWVGFVEAAVIEWLDDTRAASAVALRQMLVRVLLDALDAAAAGAPEPQG